MGPVRFYTSIFLRRLPYFLIVATVISAVSIIISQTLPPTYVSQTRLIVESPRIPDNLASSTVTTPAQEQLQIVEQRLLTRPVLLNISRQYEILPNQSSASPDQIVDEMRAQTSIRITAGRNMANLMTITFSARTGQIAAGVLNEYLTEIQKLDVNYRKERASGTHEFFEQEAPASGVSWTSAARVSLNSRTKTPAHCLRASSSGSLSRGPFRPISNRSTSRYIRCRANGKS